MTHSRTEPQPPASPATTGDRFVAMDVVRGVAVLGIVAPNIIGMGQPMVAYAWPAGFLVPPGPGSDWLWALQLTFVDGKFRGLFTLLFGAGLVLFRQSMERRGAGSAFLARRLGWLALFGVLHWALLWRGDILTTYAVAGFVALPLLALPAHKQFALGLAGYLIGAAMLLALASAMLAFDPAGWADIAAQDVADGAAEAAIMASGSYHAWVAHSLDIHLEDLWLSVLWALFETLPLILIGMSLVASGIFDGRADRRRQLHWGLALWLAGSAASAAIALDAIGGGIAYRDSVAAPALNAFPALASSLGLIALLSLWGRQARGWLARRLAAAGRCAFTNYIGTSALALAVFMGADLFGRLTRIELYALVPLFWIAMLAWPTWWLARYRYGPLEWMWRSLTYWRRVHLRR